MFKDIVLDIRPLDVLVSTNVVVEKDKVDAFDCELIIVTNDGHRVIRYFGFTLDNTEFTYDKRIMYDIDNDRDYVTDIEYENGVTGYTQYRRATEAERMVVHDLVYRNKGLIRTLAYRHDVDVPRKILDVSFEDDKAMVITFPDYIPQCGTAKTDI